MRRRLVLISPRYEMRLQSQSAPGHRLLVEQTTDCVERGKAHARRTLSGNPDGAVRTTGCCPRTQCLTGTGPHFPLFANVAPGRSRRNRSLGAPVRVLTLSDLPRRPSSSRRGHAHVWQREDRPQNGTEVIVRLGGCGELVEVIRFCGILLPARAQCREYGRPATSRATGVLSRGFLGKRGARLSLELARLFKRRERRRLTGTWLGWAWLAKRIHSLLGSLAASPSAKLAGLILPWLAC